MAINRASEAASDAKKRRLGRGLSSLIGDPVAVSVEVAAPVESKSAEPAPKPPGAGVEMIPVTQIRPNRSQPRRKFDDRALNELAESIRSAGVMQPILVRAEDGSGGYELVAGERRWRAAQLAGLTSIPALVKVLTDAESAQWALVENLQREDLGPLEKAAALKALVDKFGMTHAEVAQRVGLERVTVTNLLRLLDLEPEIASALESGELTMGHGRALLSVPSGPARQDLAARTILNQWSVRRLEKEAAEVAAALPSGNHAGRGGAGGAGNVGGDSLLEHQAGIRDLERQLCEHLGTKVRLLLRRGGTHGRLVAEFYDLDHFDGLMSKIGFKSK